MNFTEYKELAMRTNPKGKTDIENLLNACLGLVGEYAEAQSALTEYDKMDELSDLYWYTALLHSVVGKMSIPVETEWTYIKCVGTICDIVKKSAFQGHPLDLNHISLYADKLLYIMNNWCRIWGFGPGEVMEHNVNKLKNRYPAGFEVDKSVNR